MSFCKFGPARVGVRFVLVAYSFRNITVNGRECRNAGAQAALFLRFTDLLLKYRGQWCWPVPVQKMFSASNIIQWSVGSENCQYFGRWGWIAG